MSYVKESLAEDEELKYEFSFHWDVISSWYFGVMLLAFLAGIFGEASLGVVVGVLLMPLAIIRHFYLRVAIEQAVTNKRAILKKGLIARKTQEQMLSKVETVEVSQSISQRILGSGNIKITGTGNAVMIFADIDNPLDVKKKIESLL
ncbi:MAG: PH domain-containing protein [Parvibaculales bacterium]